MYPQNDSQFEEMTIVKVQKVDQIWVIDRADGWSFGYLAAGKVTPRAGMTARFYGAGPRAEVRGLFLVASMVFYRPPGV